MCYRHRTHTRETFLNVCHNAPKGSAMADARKGARPTAVRAAAGFFVAVMPFTIVVADSGAALHRSKRVDVESSTRVLFLKHTSALPSDGGQKGDA